MTSAEIRRVVQETVDFTLSHIKAQWIKDVQATLAKTDIQAATISSQLLKVDHSLLKWDERGFTFAGKQVGPNFSLNGAIHGRRDTRDKAEKEAERKLDEKKAAEARAAEKRRVQEFERQITHQVSRAQTNAGIAQEKAGQAKRDAQVARNLLNSADRHSKLAASNADRASKSFTALEERITRLESRI
ncbi:hypothetical protein AB0N06_15750 [Streptomyces sp. NPDC051020]|uniref:hypothetical protein n=1 Tax=Streptomyces sp. NPDC051020 TaxID=3155409 RepID=UPI0034162EC5